MSKIKRNLIIFAVASLGGGWAGIALDRANPPVDRMQGLGALLWLVTPLAAGLLLRALAGDGWRDAGFRPRLWSGWRWYLAALLIIPLVCLVTLGLGAAFGAISLSAAPSLGALLPLFGAAFAASMVKNLFEEFAWRGYLTPRFEALKLNPFIGYLLTGLIWAGWHIPYYLYFLRPEVLQSQTPLSPAALIALAFLLLPFQAITYGELRLLSGSVWPAWLMHTMANAVSLTLVSSGLMKLNGSLGVGLSPGSEGVVFTLLLAVIGVGLYQYRLRHSAETTIQRGLAA